jgi:hypothetical protein
VFFVFGFFTSSSFSILLLKMECRIRVRHAGVSRDLNLHQGIDVADLHALLKAGFPTAGILAGLEDDRGVLHPLSAICLNPTAFRDRSFSVAIAMPHIEVNKPSSNYAPTVIVYSPLCDVFVLFQLDFSINDNSHRVVVHYDADPSDIAGLLHTLFELPQGSMITGVRNEGSSIPLSALCDNPPLYKDRRLEIIIRETQSRRGTNCFCSGKGGFFFLCVVKLMEMAQHLRPPLLLLHVRTT